jgi:hypothetical protein
MLALTSDHNPRRKGPSHSIFALQDEVLRRPVETIGDERTFGRAPFSKSRGRAVPNAAQEPHTCGAPTFKA